MNRLLCCVMLIISSSVFGETPLDHYPAQIFVITNSPAVDAADPKEILDALNSDMLTQGCLNSQDPVYLRLAYGQGSVIMESILPETDGAVTSCDIAVTIAEKLADPTESICDINTIRGIDWYYHPRGHVRFGPPYLCDRSLFTSYTYTFPLDVPLFQEEYEKNYFATCVNKEITFLFAEQDSNATYFYQKGVTNAQCETEINVDTKKGDDLYVCYRNFFLNDVPTTLDDLTDLINKDCRKKVVFSWADFFSFLAVLFSFLWG